MNMPIFCLALGCMAALAAPLATAAPRLAGELVEDGGAPALRMTLDGKDIIHPGAGPLYEGGGCEVAVTLEALPEGVKLVYTVTNRGNEPADLPEFLVPGVEVPVDDLHFLQTWKTVQLHRFNPQQPNATVHSARVYPSGGAYSPVVGLQTPDTMLGAMLMYDLFDLQVDVWPTYRYDRRAGRFTLVFQPRNQQVDGAEGWARFPRGQLAPGKTAVFKLAIASAPADRWVDAFRPYRDFFRATYGEVRYKNISTDPIYALPLGSVRPTDDNPRGYNPGTLMHLHGWPAYRDRVRESVTPHGFKRVMIWQVSGFYQEHHHTNMVWEIATAWPDKMNETVDVFKETIDGGIDTGLWWGRAFSISGGFDSGKRHPWDPDNPDDNAAAFRELDRAYALGVRTIGCDATPVGIHRTRWSPSNIVLYQRIMPMLYERYPEMYWILEVAPADYMHLWGGSFIWDAQITGPNAFAEYLAPGAIAHSVLRRGQMRGGEEVNWQQRFDELIEWGYAPIVFFGRHGKSVRIGAGAQDAVQPRNDE